MSTAPTGIGFARHIKTQLTPFKKPERVFGPRETRTESIGNAHLYGAWSQITTKREALNSPSRGYA